MEKNPREIVFNILLNIYKNKSFSNLEINKKIPDIDKRDENLIRELVYGTIENQIYIDYIIAKASKIKIKKIHLNVMTILRMGVYQIIFMEKIPDSAAVNESVKLVKKFSHSGSIGYVNGMLRNISRNREEFLKIEEKDRSQYISIKYSHPKWLVDRWIDEFGLEETERLCIKNNSRPKLNIRVNSLKIGREELRFLLAEKNIITSNCKYAKDGLIVEEANGILDTEEFKNGFFTVQDESSMLVGQILNPKEKSLVLDMCSAPGGKATHIAQRMKNTGKVISRDVYDHKLKLIEDNAKRLGIKNIYTEKHDALALDEKLIGKVDYCLIDAPCSGIGLISRKPEIKYNRKKEDIDNLIDIQYNILNTGKYYVKTGGLLLYSTCTILKEENILIIEKFLKNNKEFKLAKIEELDNADNINTLEKGYIELYPHIHGTDGFFICKMIKEI